MSITTEEIEKRDLIATANYLRVRAAVRWLVERIATGPNYHWVVVLSDGNGHATVPGIPKTHAILGDLISPEANAIQADDESPAAFVERLETIVREHRAAKAAKLRAELAAIEGAAS